MRRRFVWLGLIMKEILKYVKDSILYLHTRAQR